MNAMRCAAADYDLHNKMELGRNFILQIGIKEIIFV